MNRDEKIKEMVETYSRKRNLAGDVPVMEFHRKHLLLFMNRFCQLLARFATPSSSLLSHELFLIVEAATIVAKSDWAKCDETNPTRRALFSKYFDAFDQLAAGIEPLGRGAALCVEVLTNSN